MIRQDHHLRLQTDGPHQHPNGGAAQRNLGLLALLLPALLAALVSQEPYGPSWSWPLALAGSLVGVIIFSRQVRRSLKNLDWAVPAVLAGLMIAVPGHRAAEFFLAPAAGLLCGFLVSRPQAGYLLARPGLLAWLALGLTGLAAWLWPPFFNGPPPRLFFGFFDWPIVCALVAAGFCSASGRSSASYWPLPWLAALAAWLLAQSHQGELQMGPPLYRIAALTLPIFFIAPHMARNRLELLIYEAVLVLLLFQPWPGAGRIADPALLWSGLIFIPRWYLDRRLRNKPPAAVVSTSPEPMTPKRPGLKCGHGGTAPRLAEWRGLSSCRLAAEHDGGPLLCPYGCLGLGDCQRLCPMRAISLEGGFPVIDPSRCRGCGRCWSVCPKQLFELNEGEVRVFIPCASQSGLKNNAEYCEKSCLGCGKCRKACPAKAIGRSGDSGAMAVDQDVCRTYGEACGQACRAACPRRII